MLENAYFLAKIGADTAENEQHFAEVLIRPSAAQASVARTTPGWEPPDGWEPPGARSRKVGSLKKKRMETLSRISQKLIC